MVANVTIHLASLVIKTIPVPGAVGALNYHPMTNDVCATATSDERHNAMHSGFVAGDE